ncbi:hypothetical protein LXL04_023751 [Taraxacum kok-saghyz]
MFLNVQFHICKSFSFLPLSPSNLAAYMIDPVQLFINDKRIDHVVQLFIYILIVDFMIDHVQLFINDRRIDHFDFELLKKGETMKFIQYRTLTEAFSELISYRFGLIFENTGGFSKYPDSIYIESGSFENSYIPENPRTTKPLTFSKNRLQRLKLAQIQARSQKFFSRKTTFFQKLCICEIFFAHMHFSNICFKNA